MPELDALAILADTGDAAAITSKHWPQAQLDALDEAGRTPLMRAAIRGDYKTAAALRAAGARLDITGPDGRKAVHLAALYGHSAVLVCLIEGGCGG